MRRRRNSEVNRSLVLHTGSDDRESSQIREAAQPALCMFDPIRARELSSFSRKGIIAVATETTIFGRDVHVIGNSVCPTSDDLCSLARGDLTR